MSEALTHGLGDKGHAWLPGDLWSGQADSYVGDEPLPLFLLVARYFSFFPTTQGKNLLVRVRVPRKVKAFLSALYHWDLAAAY